MRALANADVGQLMSVLSTDAALLMDGGGKVVDPPRSIHGSRRIFAFLATLPAKLPPEAAVRPAEVNGRPGAVVQTREQTIAVLSFRTENGRIAAIYVVVNPEKLKHVGIL